MTVTKSFSLLLVQPVLEVLGESTWFWVVWVIQGCKGVGDISGV